MTIMENFILEMFPKVWSILNHNFIGILRFWIVHNCFANKDVYQRFPLISTVCFLYFIIIISHL